MCEGAVDTPCTLLDDVYLGGIESMRHNCQQSSSEGGRFPCLTESRLRGLAHFRVPMCHCVFVAHVE
jgi:hypothetical protein